jgi:hypothetical protein
MNTNFIYQSEFHTNNLGTVLHTNRDLQLIKTRTVMELSAHSSEQTSYCALRMKIIHYWTEMEIKKVLVKGKDITEIQTSLSEKYIDVFSHGYSIRDFDDMMDKLVIEGLALGHISGPTARALIKRLYLCKYFALTDPNHFDFIGFAKGKLDERYDYTWRNQWADGQFFGMEL